jgi:cytochrome c-type biogenesis protein
MELGLSSLALAFAAGLASVASPCVLPVVPIVVTGTTQEHRSRPALVVLGLALSFIAMGVVSSLFGGAVARSLPWLEKAAGLLVLAFGLLLLVDVNVFERLGALRRLGAGGDGRSSGLVLGLTLGLVWIPCVGPMLSSVLATVAARGSLLVGVVLLFAYAAGFAIPMLAIGYGSQAVRQRLRVVARHPVVVRWVSGLLLVAFGAVILRQGMLFIAR